MAIFLLFNFIHFYLNVPFFFPEKKTHSENLKYQFWGDRYSNSMPYFLNLKWILILKKTPGITIKSLGSNEHYLFIKIQLAKNFLAKPAELGVFRYSLTVAALWPLNCRSWFFINLLITSPFSIALILLLTQESHCLLLSYRFQWIS